MKTDAVCKLPGEAEWLHRAIADFSPDGARAQYADWLAKQGDYRRAKDVRKTVGAFQKLDVKPLRRLSGSSDWHRMIAVPLLKNFIKRAANFDRDSMIEFRDLLFSTLKPGLSLSYSPSDAAVPIGSSRLWGLPDLPENEEWPTIRSASNWNNAHEDLPLDQHCAFLGQFSFSDFEGTVLGQELPKVGGFSIFTITEVHEFGIVETVFRPWSNQVALTRREPPPDLVDDKLGDGANAPHAVHEVILKEVLSLPDATDGPFKSVIPNCSWGEPYYDFYSELLELCEEGMLGFGGYLRGTSGGDPSLDVNAIRIAVLRTDPDAGIVHFSIPAEDLPTGRLDRVEYVWSDWDS